MKNLLIFIICLMTALCAEITFADEPDKIDKVISTGVGMDADTAKKSAISNAIEQVIGTYISSDIMMKNDDIIKDKVLSYSAGFVKELKILSQGKSSDGLFSIKVEASVVITKVKARLKELNISEKKLEGTSLFAEAISRSQQKNNARQLLADVLDKYPQAAYIIGISKPEIISTNESNGTARINLPYNLKFDPIFIDKLKIVFSQIAIEEYTDANMIDVFKSINYKDKSRLIACYSNSVLLKSALAEKCWLMPTSAQDEITNGNLFNGHSFWASRINMDVRFKDINGTVIDAVIVKFSGKFNQAKSIFPSGRALDKVDYNMRHFFYSNFNPSNLWYLNLPNIVARSNNDPSDRQIFVTDAIFTDNVQVDINIASLDKISSVEIKLQPVKNDIKKRRN